MVMSEGLQSIKGTFPGFSRNGRQTTKCQSSAGLKQFYDSSVVKAKTVNFTLGVFYLNFLKKVWSKDSFSESLF